MSLFQSFAVLTERMASAGESMEVEEVRSLLAMRGEVVTELVKLEPSFHRAVVENGRNSPLYEHCLDLSKKIRKDDDILIGALQQRKRIAAQRLQQARNRKQLQSYSRQE